MAGKTAAKDFTPTERTRLRRKRQRAHYERRTVYEVLDAGFICHVGYVIDGHPYVTATAYWRHEDSVYWHGSSASRMLRRLEEGVPVCFTVAHFDGLVLARSGFNSSINYRSVMVFGTAKELTDPAAKLAALEAFTERTTPGRWADLRPPTQQEIKATTVMSLPLAEAVAKIRSGPPMDDEEDYELDIWAGVVPVRMECDAPIADPRLKEGVQPPAYLRDFKVG